MTTVAEYIPLPSLSLPFNVTIMVIKTPVKSALI